MDPQALIAQPSAFFENDEWSTNVILVAGRRLHSIPI